MTKRPIEEALFGAIGTDDCHKIGIMGWCGDDCYIYREGKCEHIEEESTDGN